MDLPNFSLFPLWALNGFPTNHDRHRNSNFNQLYNSSKVRIHRNFGPGRLETDGDLKLDFSGSGEVGVRLRGGILVSHTLNLDWLIRYALTKYYMYRYSECYQYSTDNLQVNSTGTNS